MCLDWFLDNVTRATVGWQIRQLMNLACCQSSLPLLFTHLSLHQCLFHFPHLSNVKTAPEPRSCSPHHLTGATASGRVYHPILVQLNVSSPDAWPCLPGAPGSSVHRQLMANPRSESGQLFAPNAARMPPAAINAGRQETCLTHSAEPLKRLTLEGLDSQQKGILKWTEPEMLQWFTD